jgi:phage terminase large subunit-like protein
MKTSLNSIHDHEWQKMAYEWSFWARPNQLPPLGDWQIWLILAGRGFGKTRTGAEWVRRLVENNGASRIALIGPTFESTRMVMVEGESGLLNICPPSNKPTWYSSKGELHWPSGAKAMIYSADEPDRLRGPQHDALWADELAAWRYEEAFDMAMLGLRLGKNPQAVITTTPKPIPLLKRIMENQGTVITKGTTYENKENLPQTFIHQIIQKYEGTTLGAQELYAEMLWDQNGALWNRSLIEETRVLEAPDDFERIVIAIDPAVTNHENSDETGILVVAQKEDHIYILEDASGRYKPDAWAQKAVDLYNNYKATFIVAEVNQGGDLVERMLRLKDLNIPFKAVRATRNKRTRAEPIAALYEQKRVHHVGFLKELENQMCSSFSKKSPDRVDAMVWGIFYLIFTQKNNIKFNIWN